MPGWPVTAAEDATMPNDQPRPTHDDSPSVHIPPDVLRWLDAPSPEWPSAAILEDIAALGFPGDGGEPTADPSDKWLP